MNEPPTWITLGITALSSFAVGVCVRWPLEKLAERRALVRGVLDGYLSLARTSSSEPKNSFWRVKTLQQQSAVDLYWWELNKVCEGIISAGFVDPRKLRPIFDDKRRKLRPLLKWARANGVDLGSSEEQFNFRRDENLKCFSDS